MRGFVTNRFVLMSIKLVIAGDNDIGKTQLLTVLKGEPFPERLVPSIFDNYTQNVTYNGKNYALHIWDTPGQDEFNRLRPLSYQDAKVVLLCFGLNNRTSFNNAKKHWLDEINYYCKGVKIILVGTNLDLRTNTKDSVTDAEALEFCKENNFVDYIAVSAKNGTNTSEIFPKVIDCALEKEEKSCYI